METTNFNIVGADLKKTLADIGRIVERPNKWEVTDYNRIWVVGNAADGSMFIYAVSLDGDIVFKTEIRCTTSNDFSFAVDFHLFQSLISVKDEIVFSFSDNQLSFGGNSITAHESWFTAHESWFEEIRKVEKSIESDFCETALQSNIIPLALFKSLLAMPIASASKEENKHLLNCIMVQLGLDRLVVESTDGYRASRSTYTHDFARPLAALLRAESVVRVCKALNGENVLVSEGAEHIYLKTDGQLARIRKFQSSQYGLYPTLDQCFTWPALYNFEVDSKVLATAFATAAKVSDQVIVKFTITNGELDHITIGSKSNGDVIKTVVPVTGGGDDGDYTVAVNPSYIKPIKGLGTVSVTGKGIGEPVTIRHNSNFSTAYTIMPLRLRDDAEYQLD